MTLEDCNGIDLHDGDTVDIMTGLAAGEHGEVVGSRRGELLVCCGSVDLRVASNAVRLRSRRSDTIQLTQVR